MEFKKSFLSVLLCIIGLMMSACDKELTPDEEDDSSKIVDTIAPIIQFMGSKTSVIEVGTEFDLMMNVNGLDDVDKLITDNIVVDDGGFNNNKIGQYVVTYSLKDSSGNEANKLERKIIVVDSTNIKLVAHRGGKGVGLENTEAAFRNAVSMNYYGLECDVQETLDGKLVVFHDLTIDRLGNGVTGNIKDLTWDFLKDVELSKVEADGKTYTGKILLFKDYLEIVKNSDSVAFIELKETCTLSTLNKIMAEITESALPNGQYVIIANSASLDLLVELRKTNKEVQMQFVARTNWKAYISQCLDSNIDLDIDYSTLISDGNEAARSVIESFHEKGLKVNVWSLNKENLVIDALVLGVDYITTDSLVPKK